MAENNIAVKITADIVDLQTKFAIAKAEVNGLTVEMNKLAKQSASGVLDAAGAERLQQFSGDLLAARGEAQRYAGELEKAGFSMSSFASKMQGGHGSISTATREFRALFDELSSGRTRQTPGTLAIIAQRVLGLGPAALIAIGGVAALVGGLGYLAYHALQAGKALDQVHLGAEFAGNLTLTREQLEALADELAKAKGISSSAAKEIIGAFSSMHDMSEAKIVALQAVVADYAAVTGQDATKAAEAMVKIFAEHESAAAYAKSIGGVTQAQLDMAAAADKSGDANQVFVTKFQLFNSALNRARPTIDQHNAAIENSVSHIMALTGAVDAGMSAEELENLLLDEQNIKRARQSELLKQVTTQLQHMPETPDQILKVGVDLAQKENPIVKQIDDANVKIAEYTKALAVAKDQGDDLNVRLLTSSLTEAQDKLAALQFGPVVERMREQMSQIASTWDGTQSGLLEKQIQISRSVLADVQQNAKARIQIETEIAHMQVQLRTATGAELIAQARAETSEIAAQVSLGPVQRLQAEQQVWAQLLAGDKLIASQRVEVQRTFNNEEVEIARARKAQTDAIARSDAETEIAINRLVLDAKRAALETDLSANKTSAAEKLAILRNLALEDEALSEKALTAELQGLTQGTAEYERVYNQIRELKAKLNLELTALDRQYQEDVKRQLKEQTTLWKQAVGEIENAESSLISDLISRRKSLSQTLLQISTQMVTSEITNDVKAYTTKELLHNSEKALDQGGFLYHMLFEQQKAAATVTNQAAQTTAVSAGETARTAAETTAAATSASITATTGPAQVLSDAAVAAAGAYAATAPIPYVGPILAPIAAAEAYAAVAAFAPEAAFAVGAWNLPRDMVGLVHAGESIVPKDFASGAREAGFGLDGDKEAPQPRQSALRDDSAGSDTHFHAHINAMDSRNVIQQLRKGGLLDSEMRRAFSHHTRQ